jgi:hypothetical protein
MRNVICYMYVLQSRIYFALPSKLAGCLSARNCRGSATITLKIRNDIFISFICIESPWPKYKTQNKIENCNVI